MSSLIIIASNSYPAICLGSIYIKREHAYSAYWYKIMWKTFFKSQYLSNREKVIAEGVKCFTKTLDRSCILLWDNL